MGEGWFNHLIVDDQQKFLETTVLKCRQTQQPTVQLIDKNIYANMKFIYVFWEGHKILRNLSLTFDYSKYSQK